MKKKLLCVVAVLAMLVSLAACGSKTEPSSSASSSAPAPSSSSASSSAASSSQSEQKTVTEPVVPDNFNTTQYKCRVNSPDGLILRIGPGTEYEALDVVTEGTELTELANQKGWIYVEYKNQRGWVFGQFVEYTG